MSAIKYLASKEAFSWNIVQICGVSMTFVGHSSDFANNICSSAMKWLIYGVSHISDQASISWFKHHNPIDTRFWIGSEITNSGANLLQNTVRKKFRYSNVLIVRRNHFEPFRTTLNLKRQIQILSGYTVDHALGRKDDRKSGLANPNHTAHLSGPVLAYAEADFCKYM